MPDEDQYPHIRDNDTVYMQDPKDGSVGSALGKAFKEVYAPQGYTQVDRAAWDEHMAVLNEERQSFESSNRLAPMPDDPDAQDIINAERGVQRTDSTDSVAPTGYHQGEG
jgi:hypothetical protein